MDVTAYLDRLGVTARAADAETLAALHRAHLERVPFENLEIHLGRRLSLDPSALFDKIVRRRRGGFCYELNGLFGLLLRELGFGTTLLGAAVWTGERYSFPLDHVALRVRCADGGEWLADVGFGDHSLLPLRWTVGEVQHDPAGEFILRADGDDVEVIKNGDPAYRLEPHPRDLADCAAMCWYQQASPDSHFTRNVVCSRATSSGRITLSGTRLIETRDGVRRERRLDGDEAVLAAYRDEFGVELDRAPTLP